MQGWIKLHRKLIKHWIFQDADYLRFWIYLLLDVNHEKAKVIWNKKLIEIEKGEKITSLKKLAYEFNCSRGKVRHFLKLLENENMIEIKGNTKYTHISICKYANYQVNGNSKETDKEQPKNGEKTPDDTNKNDKNDKNEKEYKIPDYLEFKNFALGKQPNLDIDALKNKYEAWKENGWRDLNDKKIKNWKSKVINNLQYWAKNEKQLGTPRIVYKNGKKQYIG